MIETTELAEESERPEKSETKSESRFESNTTERTDNAGGVVLAACRSQLTAFRRAPVTTLLTIFLPVNLLLLLSLFALTGYRAPTALVYLEDTPTARAFAQALADAHHSFNLKPMSLEQANRDLARGKVVAEIEMPTGFEQYIKQGDQGFVYMRVDNVNIDLAEDVRRAVRAAVVIFAQQQHMPDVKITPELRDVLPYDTGYVQYLGVSAIALAAVIAGGVLGGTVTAREWEQGTARLMRISPSGSTPVLIGRLLAAGLLGLVASVVTAGVVVFGYGVHLLHPAEAAITLAATVACATAFGGLLGSLLKRTLVITPLIVGLTLPFYLDSGALEPQRFDGETLFWLAHLSPTYYAVGAIEHAFHGLAVTPESVPVLLGVLLAGTAGSLVLLGRAAR